MAVLARGLNVLALFGIIGVLLFAFYPQLKLGEVPCALCLLQRAALIAAGFGFMLNVRFGSSESHYGVVIVSALAGGAVAARQVLQYIAPDFGSFGLELFGWHLYTWTVVLFFALALLAGVQLFIQAQFFEGVHDLRPTMLSYISSWVFVAVALAHAVSTVLQCGFGPCAGSMVEYELLQK